MKPVIGDKLSANPPKPTSRIIVSTLLSRKAALERERVRAHGPAPTCIFKTLRLQHQFTQERLCGLIYLSKQALIRLEQGTYDTPLPVVLEWWANHVCAARNCPANDEALLRPGEPLGELYLRDAYAEFQQLQRRRYKHCFGPSLVFNSVELARIYDERYHPFRVLRDRACMSVTEVAKSLCVPQATVEHFEKKWRTQQSVPKNLRYALKEIGYPSDDIGDFINHYLAFRKNVSLGTSGPVVKYDADASKQLGTRTFTDSSLPPNSVYFVGGA